MKAVVVRAQVAALALLGAGLASPALAQEGVFLKDLLGQAGLIAREQADIDYRERAPLVVPPRLELREPGPGGAQARGPQWPNDPDIVAARRRQADARTPVTELERRQANERNPRLSPADLRAGRRPGAGTEDEPVYRGQGNGRDATWVNPEVLRRNGQARADGATRTADGQEPERKLLIEPPAGLRRTVGKPVAAGSEPIGVDRSREEASPLAFFRRITED